MMSSAEKEHHIIEKLDAIGLNVWGIASGESWQEILPGCQSVIVFASGGTALWDAFVQDILQHPTHLTECDHPLDAFVARTIQTVDPSPPPNRRWVRCAADAETFVDFQQLSADANMGFESRMGLLIHPQYGLWIGLRAAYFTTTRLQVPSNLNKSHPCEPCDAPCIRACPGEAFPNDEWDVHRCAAFHVESDACHGICHARCACPIGTNHRHKPLQHHCHNARNSGRKKLAAHLNIVNDTINGIGPHWEAWSKKR